LSEIERRRTARPFLDRRPKSDSETGLKRPKPESEIGLERPKPESEIDGSAETDAPKSESEFGA
jgi:hypothetical protein